MVCGYCCFGITYERMIVSSPYAVLFFVVVMYLYLRDLDEQNMSNRRQKIKYMITHAVELKS